MTHICIRNLTIIGSDNGLAPDRRQAIIWTNARILLIRPLRTNFREILIAILTFSFKRIRLKVSSAKWRPFCLCLNVFKDCHPSTRNGGYVSSICWKHHIFILIWWHHQMETFSALLALCAGKSPMNSSHKGQWHGALMFPLSCAWINARVNNHEAGDLRRHRAHYDVIVMIWPSNIYLHHGLISISDKIRYDTIDSSP